jgi:K+-sensing histidine kinase KdpD
VVSEHRARGLLLGLGLVFAAAGVWAWWWGLARDRHPRHRERIALALTATTVPAFLGLVAVLGADRPEAYLPLGAALVCSMAPVIQWTVRVPVQVLTGLFFAVLLVRAGRSLPDLLLPLVFLVSVAVLATALARDLGESRAAERDARRDAQRRAELLTAVRALPGATLEEAAAAACGTMRSLGYDAAGCNILRGDRLVSLHLEGLPLPAMPLRAGEGLSGACIAGNRTLVIADYQGDARRLDARRDVGSVVVVPIRVEKEAVGSLMGARTHRSTPTPAEVEVAEVLAAHLGAVFATEEAVRRQRELLVRMGQLETMRSSFVGQVSDELRDPLTIVRGVAVTLENYGPDIGTAHRHQLLADMGEQTDQLRRTIDALLDFSRFQSARPEPAIGTLTLDELLTPVLVASDAELVAGGGELSAAVRVDGALIRHALELLLAGTGAVGSVPQLRVAVHEGGAEIAVHADAEATAPPALVRSLVAQLLVAAGAALDDGPDPVVRLPLADREAVVT